MKDLLEKILSENEIPTLKSNQERSSFYKEVEKFKGTRFKNKVFYGMNPVRKIDDYLSSNFLKGRYEKKIKFAKEQFEKSSSFEASTRKYKLKIEKELETYNLMYGIKATEILEKDTSFWDLSKEYSMKEEKFLKNKKSFSTKFKHFFNKFYDRHSFQRKILNSVENKSKIENSLIKLEYQDIKDKIKSHKKYLNESFKNQVFLRKKLIYLNRENLKIQRILQEISSSKIYYKDYLVSSIPLGA